MLNRGKVRVSDTLLPSVGLNAELTPAPILSSRLSLIFRLPDIYHLSLSLSSCIHARKCVSERIVRAPTRVCVSFKIPRRSPPSFFFLRRDVIQFSECVWQFVTSFDGFELYVSRLLMTFPRTVGDLLLLISFTELPWIINFSMLDSGLLCQKYLAISKYLIITESCSRIFNSFIIDTLVRPTTYDMRSIIRHIII